MKIRLKLLITCLIFLFAILIFNGFVTAVGTCSGTVHACNSHNGYQSACTSAGCNYNANQNTCTSANHFACSTYSSQSTCESHTCTWTEDTTTTTGSGGVQAVIGIFPRAPLGGDSVESRALQLQVQIYYAGEPSNSASVSASSSIFNDVTLTHKSGSADGIYSANVTIDDDVEPGDYRILYTATQSSQFNEADIIVSLENPLNLAMNLQDTYNKGSKMTLSGTVTDSSGNPIKNSSVEISGLQSGNKIFEIATITKEDGGFSINYSIKYSDPEGSWDISAKAVSEDKKVGTVSLSTRVEVPAGVDYFSVNFLSPLKDKEFKRGETIPLTVDVKYADAAIQNAQVVVYTPDGSSAILTESEPGVYSGAYVIKPTDSLGNWFLRAEVTKQTDTSTRVGGANLPIKVSSLEIQFNILSPTSTEVGTNSRINFKIQPLYPDGSLVRGANFEVKLSNGQVIQLFETTPGIYEGSYLVTLEDVGTLKIESVITDAEQNVGTLEKNLLVIKRGIIGNAVFYAWDKVKQYWWAIFAFLIAAGLIYKPSFEISWIKARIQKLSTEQKNLKTIQIDAEKKYYKEGSLTKKEFRDTMEKYEESMTKAKAKEKIYRDKLSEKISKVRKKG